VNTHLGTAGGRAVSLFAAFFRVRLELDPETRRRLRALGYLP
jgi:hypothetical protein